MGPRILLLKHPLPTNQHLPRTTPPTLRRRASIRPHLVRAQPLQHLSLQPLLEPEVPGSAIGADPFRTVDIVFRDAEQRLAD